MKNGRYHICALGVNIPFNPVPNIAIHCPAAYDYPPLPSIASCLLIVRLYVEIMYVHKDGTISVMKCESLSCIACGEMQNCARLLSSAFRLLMCLHCGNNESTYSGSWSAIEDAANEHNNWIGTYIRMPKRNFARRNGKEMVLTNFICCAINLESRVRRIRSGSQLEMSSVRSVYLQFHAAWIDNLRLCSL